MILASLTASLLGALVAYVSAYWAALAPEMNIDAALVALGVVGSLVVLWANDVRADHDDQSDR